MIDDQPILLSISKSEIRTNIYETTELMKPLFSMGPKSKP